MKIINLLDLYGGSSAINCDTYTFKIFDFDKEEILFEGEIEDIPNKFYATELYAFGLENGLIKIVI